jgi:selenocysteine-specific elongation factor
VSEAGSGAAGEDRFPLHVVATAGHVDHGKSTLIRRITGIDPDRLEEEKRRGLTIELGYAWSTLPSGREVGFVDVPGHERFVRTMLAGVGPVRVVLFVVAADEGWRPQSEEHLAIIDVLGLDGGVVALTRSDAVDEPRLRETERDVRGRLAGTALEGAAIIPVSGITGEGVDALLLELDRVLGTVPPTTEDGSPRLFVDRVFSISGAGTVATGTLTGGPLEVGEDVETVPGGARGRIRGLQRHQRPLQVARPVSRVAVNVAGTDRDRIARGEVLGRPGDWTPTDVFEAHLVPVRGLAHPLGARGAFTVHVGAAERTATLRVLGQDEVPAAGAFVRIRVGESLALDVFDRFVLRESGRDETVAGGVILDPSPPPRPGPDPERRLRARAGASRRELPRLLVAERGASTEQEAARLGGSAPEHVEGAIRSAGWWIAEDLVGKLQREITDALEATPAGELDASAVRHRLEASLRAGRAPSGASDAILDHLLEIGVLARDGATVSAPGRQAPVDHEGIATLVEAVERDEPTPPTISELGARGLPTGALDAAVRSGALVRIAPDLVMTPRLVSRAVAIVREAGAAGITVSGLRQALGTSRKFAVPLIEHLDRAGETRRSGDLRFARGS